MAGGIGREHVQPGADDAGGDALDRRRSRYLDTASGSGEGAVALPAERPPSRATWTRAHRQLLRGAAFGWQPACQHFLRPWPGRRLALQARENRLHARAHADRARQDLPRHDTRPRPHHRPLAPVDGSPDLQARTLRTQGERPAPLRAPPHAGLGGWCLGYLVVMTTMPTVPLDDQLLAVASIGVPVGLGIYLAWVNRD